MKIQKGIVKYKDRNDIVCTYGVTEDGRQYFFLDENGQKKFSNGNRIASTELVEAIDPMVKAEHVGVIDSNGNEVIPFVNKSIRPVNDSIILVEVSTPSSQSVVEAISLKSDPLSATKLVSTPAIIKEKLNAKMGNDGRYIFNDQFSEATICDIDGNNLINNEYFSFVGLTADKLYFSKNIPESEITEYSIMPPEVQTNETQAIDITQAQVPVEAIESVFSQEEAVQSTDVSAVEDEVIPTVSEEPENIYANNAYASNVVVPTDAVASTDVVAPSDMFVPTDVVVPSDMSVPTDVVVPSDMSVPTDVVVPSDMSVPSDVVAPSDMFGPTDVVAPTDMSVPTDVVVPSDMSVPTDVVVPTDMSAPINSVGQPNAFAGVDMGYVGSSMFDTPPENKSVANYYKEEVSAETNSNDSLDSSFNLPIVDEPVEEPVEVATPKSSIIVIPPVEDNNVNVVGDVMSSSESDISARDIVIPPVDEETVVSETETDSDVIGESEIAIPIVDENNLEEESSQESDSIPQVDSEPEEELKINIYDTDAKEEVKEDSSDTVESTDDFVVSEEKQDSDLDDSIEVSLPDVEPQSESELPPMVEDEIIEDISENIETSIDDASNDIFDDIHDVSEVVPDEIEAIEDDLIESDEFSDTTTLDTMVGEISAKTLIDDIDDDILDLDDSMFTTQKSELVKKVSESEEYMDSFDNDLYSKSQSAVNDSIMADVAKSLSNLMKQNRSQKSTITQYQEKLNKVSASRRSVIEKSKAQEQKIEMQEQKLGIQEQKIEVLNSKNKSCEATINNLESKLKLLESRLREQDKLIATQSQELEVLRPQKDDLAKLVADAQALLGDDDSSGSYDYDDSYFRRAA